MVLPVALAAGCAKSPASPGAVAGPGNAPAATAAAPSGAPAARTNAASPAKPGAPAATAPGARVPGSAPGAAAPTNAPAGTKPGTKPAPGGVAPQAPLESLLVTPADLGGDWKASPAQPYADDPNAPHEFCQGPFKTDAYRVGRKQTAVHQEPTQNRVEEEATRYQAGRAKDAIAEFRRQFEQCKSWSQGTPPDNFTASLEPAPDAPRIGADSVSVRVRYTAGPYVVFSVMTIAVQGDVLLLVSSVANTPEAAMGVTRHALPIAARRAGFAY